MISLVRMPIKSISSWTNQFCVNAIFTPVHMCKFICCVNFCVYKALYSYFVYFDLITSTLSHILVKKKDVILFFNKLYKTKKKLLLLDWLLLPIVDIWIYLNITAADDSAGGNDVAMEYCHSLLPFSIIHRTDSVVNTPIPSPAPPSQI